MVKASWRYLIGWIWRLPFGCGRAGVILFVLGFMILIGGAIKEWILVGSGMGIVAIGLTSISVGIGFIAVGAAYKADTQTKSIESGLGGTKEKFEKVATRNWKTSLILFFLSILIVFTISAILTRLKKSLKTYQSKGQQ